MRELITSLKIYGYDQEFSKLSNLFKSNILPNKILITGPKGIGKYTFAIHFINYALSINEENKYDIEDLSINKFNRSFILMNSSIHPCFNLINLKTSKKFIDIDQIRNTIDFTQKKSFNNEKRFILIDNVEYLNESSSNALLKILEEPPENLYFFLVHSDTRNLTDTIKSRCITFKKSFSNEETAKILNTIVSNFNENINECYLNKYHSIGEIVSLLNFAKDNDINIKEIRTKELINIIILKKLYKNDPFLSGFMFNLMHSYFYERFKETKNIKIFELYEYFIIKTNETIKYNLDIENLFYEFKNKAINE